MSERRSTALSPTGSVYRRLALPIYVPSLLSSISLQALLVLLPLYVLEQGTGAPFAAFLIGLRGFGMLLFDLPVSLWIVTDENGPAFPVC